MATKGVLALREQAVLEMKAVEYILPSRASSEPCENGFSIVRERSGEQNPGPLKTKQQLRTIAIAQSLKVPRNCNYLKGDDFNLLEARDLTDMASANAPRKISFNLSDLQNYENAQPNNRTALQENGNFFVLLKSYLFILNPILAVYYYASWLGRKVIRECKFARSCLQCALYLAANEVPLNEITLMLRRLSRGRLSATTMAFYDLVHQAENFLAALKDQRLLISSFFLILIYS